MVCGHLDRNALARAVTALLAGDLANLVTSTDPCPSPLPCDEHPAPRRAAIPGALPSAGQPGAAARPAPATARPRPASPQPGTTPPRPARRTDPRRAGPAPGHPAALRRQPPVRPRRARRLPADPAHRRVLPLREPAAGPRRAHRASPARTCAAPSSSATGTVASPAAPPRPSAVMCITDPPVQGRPDPPGQPDAALCTSTIWWSIHRWGWALTLHADGTTTAKSPDGIRTLHSHGPPPGQDTLWADRPGHGPPATAA